jgi:hypothetical protein
MDFHIGSSRSLFLIPFMTEISPAKPLLSLSALTAVVDGGGGGRRWANSFSIVFKLWLSKRHSL